MADTAQRMTCDQQEARQSRMLEIAREYGYSAHRLSAGGYGIVIRKPRQSPRYVWSFDELQQIIGKAIQC